MTQASNLSSARLSIWSLIVALVAFPALTCADKPTQTISEPGFRPDSQYATDFLGARIAISENLGASLSLARKALAHENIDSDQTEALLRSLHEEYYAKFVSTSTQESPDQST